VQLINPASEVESGIFYFWQFFSSKKSKIQKRQYWAIFYLVSTATLALDNENFGGRMSIYLILENQIHDVEAYERYKTAVKPMVEAAGGEYLTRDGKVDVLVGDWIPSRVVIFKWPGQEALETFMSSEDYKPWKELRESVTTTKTLVRVEGVDHKS